MQNETEENTTVAPWTDERFLRSRIVLGSEGLERLWGAHVVVVGYGVVVGGHQQVEMLNQTV